MTAVERFLEECGYVNTYSLQKRFSRKWGYTLSRLERQGRIRRLSIDEMLILADYRGDKNAGDALKAHPRARTFWCIA